MSLPATPHATDEDYADRIHGIAVVGNSIVGVGTTDQVLFVDETVPGAFTVVGAVRPGPAVTGQIPVPPAVPTPRPPSVPAQPPLPGTVTWEVQALPVSAPPGAAVRESTVVDVARWKGGFAAVGRVQWESFDVSLGARSVVWTSPDGARWTEHPLPSPCGGGQIAATRTAMVVVGADICRSTDGAAWTRVTDTPSRIRSADDVVDVIAGGPGFVMAMRHQTSTTVSTRVWRSVDGLHWRSAGSPAALGGLEPKGLAAGSRGIVILGQPYVARRYVPTIAPLRSPDGSTWSRGLRQRAFEPLSLKTRASMVRGGPGYVAAGSYQPRSRVGAAVWTSPDGFTWKRVYSVLPASGFVEFGGLARIGPGYAVVGLLAPPSQEDPALPTVWLSPDGTRWRAGVSLPLPTDGPVASLDIAGVAGGSARIAAVGSRWDGAYSRRAEVWTGTYRAP